MKIWNTIFVSGYTKDGYLGPASGRIIMYEDNVLIGWNSANDHNDLLRAFAQRYRYKKDEIVSNAIRLYFTKVGNTLVVSECRRIDYDIFTKNEKRNLQLIREEASR
jgi:hypothetical protein